MDHHHLLQSELGYQRGMQEVWLEGCLMKKKKMKWRGMSVDDENKGEDVL